MPTYVLDTSVCIDLHVAGLLAVFLDLPGRKLLPDVVVAELREPPGRDVLTLGFVVASLSGEEMVLVATLAELYRKPSVADVAALVYAKSHRCVLLTGDAALRSAAEEEELWCMDSSGCLTSLSEVI